MNATQLSSNSTSADPWTMQEIDIMLVVVGSPVVCFVIAAIAICLWIRDCAMLEHQGLLSEKGTTEHAAIDNKTKVDLKAGSADEPAEPEWVWELDYTVEVAGPNGEQVMAKVTKQQVPLDSPAAAGLEEAKTVEVMFLPSQPHLVNLEVFAMQDIKVSHIGNIFLQVFLHLVGLFFLCCCVSLYEGYGPGVPDDFPQFVALWFLVIFAIAGVAYLRRWKMDIRAEPRSGTVTVTSMNSEVSSSEVSSSEEEALLA